MGLRDLESQTASGPLFAGRRLRSLAVTAAGALAALTVVMAGGCGERSGGDGSGGEWAGTVTDSAGITVVHNPDRGLWSEGDAWTVEEELRIGSVAGDQEYQLGQVGWIAVGDEGEIHVLDVLASSISTYDAEGPTRPYVRGSGQRTGRDRPGEPLPLRGGG